MQSSLIYNIYADLNIQLCTYLIFEISIVHTIFIYYLKISSECVNEWKLIIASRDPYKIWRLYYFRQYGGINVCVALKKHERTSCESNKNSIQAWHPRDGNCACQTLFSRFHYAHLEPLRACSLVARQTTGDRRQLEKGDGCSWYPSSEAPI